MESVQTGSRPRLLAPLLLALILLALIGLAVRGEQLRAWWLSRQSLDALKTVAAQPNADAQVRFLYGKKLLAANRRQEALEAFQAAESALPANASSPLTQQIKAHLGYSLAYFNRQEEAIPRLERARQLNEDDPLVALGIGQVFAARNQHEFALTQFQLAVGLDPRLAEAWFRLGLSLKETKQLQPAIEALTRAVALAPNNPNCHLHLGIVYANQKNYAEAARAFRRASELAPERLEFRVFLGNALALKARAPEEYREATALLEEALRAQPEDVRAHFALGQMQLRANDLAAARVHLRRAVDLAPNLQEAWYLLAQTEERLGNAPAARKARAVYQQWEALNTRARVADKQIVVDPADPERRRQLARLYLEQGNLRGAVAQFAIAQRLKPDPRTERELEAALAQLRRSEAAGRRASPEIDRFGPPPPNGIKISELLPDTPVTSSASPGTTP